MVVKKSEGPKRRVTKKATTSNSKVKAEKKPSADVGYSLNWERAIYINATIDDTLLRELTPVILKMKQENSEPITVGIDSSGGSIAAIDSLLGLLKSPDQDGNRPQIYTAATNKAFSAAASLLAFGDYSVAFPHCRIFYHDVRYSGIDDVTPSKALQTARELERTNAAFSLRLADNIRRRLLWIYIDLRKYFPELRKTFATFTENIDKTFEEIFAGNKQVVDIVGFSLALYRMLTAPADNEIALRALFLLDSSIQIERIEHHLSKGEQEGKKTVDIVQGFDDIVTEIRKMESSQKSTQIPEADTDAGLGDNAREDIKLLMEVLARRYATDKNMKLGNGGFDTITEDFSFVKDINSSQHLSAIKALMIDHSSFFFDSDVVEKLKGADEKERDMIFAPVYPQARLLWHYMVLICKCLCKGDHLLTPGDAQLLGLVDEVLGGGPVESRREWRKKNRQ